MSYGFDSTAGLNNVTKPFNYHMHQMTRYLHNTLNGRKSEFNLDTLDLSEEFNHCSVLLYYAGTHLKKRAQMGFHTDCAYRHVVL